jgi:hypothetical protein
MFAVGAIAGFKKRITAGGGGGGANLIHFAKTVRQAYSQTAASDTEETNYTITWAELSAAGFQNGDTAIVICHAKQRSNNNAGYSNFKIRSGADWASCATWDYAFQSIESAQTSGGHQFGWIGEVTLTANHNVYFSSYSNSTYTNTTADFSFLIFKKSQLGSNVLVNSLTHTGDAPTTLTDGASITLGAGNWLIFGYSAWLDDSTSANAWMEIHVNSSWVATSGVQGEDTANTFLLNATAYVPNVSAGTTAKIAYRTGTASTHDCVRTRIVAINADALHGAVVDYESETHNFTVLQQLDVVQSLSFTPSATTQVFVLSNVICSMDNAAGQRILVEITKDGTPFPDANSTAIITNGPNGAFHHNVIGGYTSMSSGVEYDFVVTAAQWQTVGNPSSTTGQLLAILPMKLAA